MDNLDTDRRAHELLNTYHDQLRDLAGNATGRDIRIERIGPIVRETPTKGKGLITYRDLGGLDGEELNSFIAQQTAHFARAGVGVEWRHHHYDVPDDLPERLRANGFAFEESQTVMIAEAIDMAIASRLPAGVRIREVGSDEDLERLRDFQARVQGHDVAWLPETLRGELLNSPTSPLVLLAESDDEVIAACWLRFHPGSEFASLWGGATAPQWRGEGVYRALLAYRAQQALRHGYRYLRADCTAGSAAILRHLGAAAVARTSRYIWDGAKIKS